jgi:hypothetical protein
MGSANVRVKTPYRLTIPPVSGMISEGSNKTKLTRSVGKISISCDFCAIEYETYAAWAKRYTKHFCSVACKQASMIDRVEVKCVICGSTFYITPSNVDVLVTCSKDCEHKNRTNTTVLRHEKGEFPILCGERASNVKLKESDIKNIRDDKRKQREIAFDYGVTRETISAIKRRRVWKHVD